MKKYKKILPLLILLLLIFTPLSQGLKHDGGLEVSQQIEESMKSEEYDGESLTKEEAESILIHYSDYFEQRNITSTTIRNLKRGLINVAFSFAESAEKSFYTVLEHLDIIQSSAIYLGSESKLRPIVMTLLILALSLSAYSMYYGSSSKPYKDISKNVIVIICLFVLVPSLANSLIKLTQVASKEIPGYFQEGQQVTTISEAIYRSAFYDLKLMDQADFPIPLESDEFNTTLDASLLKSMNIDEIIDPKESKYPEVFTHEIYGDGLVKIPSRGLLEKTTSLGNFSPGYFRWSLKFLLPFASLIILVMTYLFAGLRTARIIIDLAVNRIALFLVAPLSVNNIEKLKVVLRQFILSFVQIFGIALTLSVFGLYVTLINNSELSGLMKTMFFMGGGYGAIDGAKFFESAFGIDVGLRSQQAMLGALTSPITRLGGSAKNLLYNPAKNLHRTYGTKARLERASRDAHRKHSTGMGTKREQLKMYKDIAKGKGSFPKDPPRNNVDSSGGVEYANEKSIRSTVGKNGSDATSSSAGQAGSTTSTKANTAKVNKSLSKKASREAEQNNDVPTASGIESKDRGYMEDKEYNKEYLDRSRYNLPNKESETAKMESKIPKKDPAQKDKV